MKTKFFTLVLALITSTGILFAESGTCGENLTWELIDGVLTIDGTGDMTNWNSYSDVPWYAYRETITSLTIGNSVTSIGTYAFCGCSGLTSIEIPNSVTYLGAFVFDGCGSLTSIEIPNSVTSIGVCAFAYCSSLTSVTIGEGVTSIGDQAFFGCTGLTSIEIPNSVTYLGAFVFDGCSSLTSIIWNAKKCEIGQSSGYPFYGLRLQIKSLTFGDEVEYIPTNLWSEMINLTTLVGPVLVFDIPEGSWVDYPKQLQTVKVTKGELTANAFGFINRSYKTLHSLDISGVTNTTLADEAFKDSYNLKELKLPANLTSISYMAVAGCVSLKAIDIPASVEEIDNRAFEDCRSLETITFGGKQPASKPEARMALAAESKLRRIGNWAFYNAHDLQHLEIPEGVEEIGDAAFYGCSYLQDLVLPESIQKIGDNCFALCSKLEKITINALTPPIIYARTFYDVSRAIPVYVPEEAVEAYNDAAYWQEMNIQSEEAPHGIESVSSETSITRKLLLNGTLFILRDGKLYTPHGARVE